MRIISEFHDYYDCVQSYGQDSDRIYVRKESIEIIDKKGIWPFPRIYRSSKIPFCCKDYVIGFCGKVYPCVHVYPCVKDANLFSMEELDSYVESTLPPRKVKEFHNPGRYIYCERKSFVTFFHRVTEYQNSYTKMFEDKKCPIFVADERNSSIIWNANLKNFGFAKIKDPYTAYQEISMFMSNLAFPNKPIPKVSDEILCEAKGFDKFSFRKDKSS